MHPLRLLYSIKNRAAERSRERNRKSGSRACFPYWLLQLLSPLITFSAGKREREVNVSRTNAHHVLLLSCSPCTCCAVKLFQAPLHGRNSLLKFAHAAASATLHPSLSVRNDANLRAIAIGAFFMRDPSFSMEMSCVQSAGGFVHSSGNFIYCFGNKAAVKKFLRPFIISSSRTSI